MSSAVLIGVTGNTALLLALVLTYEMASRQLLETRGRGAALLQGAALGAIGVVVIEAAVRVQAGIMFDTRSILLGVSGLFFGTVPTVVAMLMTAGYRVLEGGVGTAVGVLLVFTSGGLGLLWRRLRSGPLDSVGIAELYLFGVTLHVLMLVEILGLGPQIAAPVLTRMGLPVLLVYPVGTVLLGLLLADRFRLERMLDALASSEARYRSLFENEHTVMLLIDPETGELVDANPAAARFYGLGRDRLRSTPIADINVLSREEVRREIERARAHDRRFFEFRHQLADGSVRDVEVYSGPISVGDRELLYSIVHDVSERKRAEADRERLRSQLGQAQKLESIGRLAGGVAHDFNNMLAIILGRTDLALSRVEASHPLREELDEIRSAAERSADLTRQLLAFARKQVVEPRVLDLNQTVTRMLKMLRRLIGEAIELHWVPGEDLPPVRIDPAQIDQVLANLTVNARDALGGSGTITITTFGVDLDQEAAARIPEAEPGRYVGLSVEDDGPGIDQKDVDRVFEPFFTTKAPGEGTGLGLATVYGIVRQNGGFIQVATVRGEGSAFRVHLPATREAPTPDHIDPEPAPAARGTETILLVEDQEAVLDLAARLLDRLGYTVLATRSPFEAQEIASAHADSIDLLLTDVIMPEMNGTVMARRIRERVPGLRTLFMSGYTADTIGRHGVLDADTRFVQKPFTITQLATAVRQALDAAASVR